VLLACVARVGARGPSSISELLRPPPEEDLE